MKTVDDTEYALLEKIAYQAMRDTIPTLGDRRLICKMLGRVYMVYHGKDDELFIAEAYNLKSLKKNYDSMLSEINGGYSFVKLKKEVYKKALLSEKISGDIGWIVSELIASKT